MTVTRLIGAALLFAALALFASSSAAAPPHLDAPTQAVARAPAPTATPTLEESCTGQLWEWMAPYWDLGDNAAPPGLDARYRSCMKPWNLGTWFSG
jgi:hypothetical protein